MVITLPVAVDDAEVFVALVESIANGTIDRYRPSELVLVKINNWFGARWLGFSVKALGALGVWAKQLTIPPFVPNRVVWQERYSANAAYSSVGAGEAIHIAATGENAIRRRVADVAPASALLWFTGRSQPNRRGAIMGYVPIEGSVWTWYANWIEGDPWRIGEWVEITPKELEDLRSL